MSNYLQRIYAEFLMPSRLSSYRNLLEIALDLGYEFYPIKVFWKKILKGELRSNRKYFILRKDIDTDAEAAKLMFEIERDLGIKASYYFRLRTIDVEFLQRIEDFGGEASYHFEEIATVAKKMRLKTREQVLLNMESMKELFKSNIEILRKQTGLDMEVVAAHGDFINRRLGVLNYELLLDDQFREEVGVELEVYDEKFCRYITSRHRDMLYPKFWHPTDPLEAMMSGENIVYVLVHPRVWHSNVKENLKENALRFWEGIRS